MFSELIRRNSKRNRQENTLYFVTMILTVAAFYIILALWYLCACFISWYILRISIRWNGEVMSLEPM